MINKCYPANHYLKKFKKVISSSCSLTKLVHLFLVLSVYEKVWQDVLGFIKSESYNECVLYWKDV